MGQENIAVELENLVVIINDPDTFSHIDQNLLGQACVALSSALKKQAFKPFLYIPQPRLKVEPLEPDSSNSRQQISDRIAAVEAAKTDDYIELAKIGGLDPATSHRWSNLIDVNFKDHDLSGYDFTGSLITPPSFENANIENAIFDDTQREAFKFFSLSAPSGKKKKTPTVSYKHAMTIVASERHDIYSLETTRLDETQEKANWHIDCCPNFVGPAITSHIKAKEAFQQNVESKDADHYMVELMKAKNAAAFHIISDNSAPTFEQGYYEEIRYQTALALVDVISACQAAKISAKKLAL